MGIRLQAIIILMGIIALVYLINIVRCEKIDLKYVLIWMFADVIIIIMAIFPKLIDYGAKLIGVLTPINAVFFIGIILEAAIIFSLTIAQSKNSQKVKQLAQQMALLEKEKNSIEYSENIYDTNYRNSKGERQAQ